MKKFLALAVLVLVLMCSSSAHAAILYVQGVAGCNNKVSSTSLTCASAATVTTGNDIFLSFGSLGGSSFSASSTGTAVVTWTLEGDGAYANKGKSAHASLFRGHVQTTGTVTSVSVFWSGSQAAKGLAAAEFTGVTSTFLTDLGGGSTSYLSLYIDQSEDTNDGWLYLGTCMGAFGASNATMLATTRGNPGQTATLLPVQQTTGGKSNVSVTLAYLISSGTSTTYQGSCWFMTPNGEPLYGTPSVGSGAVYQP